MVDREYLEKNLDRIHDWIRNVDQKITALMAIIGLTLTLLSVRVAKELGEKVNLEISVPYVVALTAATVFSGLCLFSLISAVVPSISTKYSKKKNSLSYFDDIANVTSEEYEARIRKSTEEDILNDLVSQIHISSKIAQNRYVKFTDAVVYFIFALSAFATFLIPSDVWNL